ncbi:RNA polymerase sigma-54 factor [Rhodobacter sp. KR11]|uniref:RNA polymerase factor sigma-54 n=1 Tax=Rhodobacter sp. KR11 TaxID=2974588 RepID=UPI002222A886|nr:RNA polymerase sigma-54 factor [Rhodobacter sp. KR11]MCW1920481.1 RNA polymerase sigma-54 factor [Rhodobacter sp. KR11]
MSQRPRIEVRQSLRLKLTTGLHTAIQVLRMDGPALARHLEEQAAEVPGLVVRPPMPRDWLPRWTGVFEGEIAAPATSSLMGHVLGQIDLRIKGAAPRRIALALAEALGPAGWLERSVPAVARDLGVPVVAVDAVLVQLQEIEPTGIFARDLADCLRLQAAEAGVLDPVMALILSRLDLLARADFAALAALAAVEEAEVLRRFRTIRTMNPKPGASFDDRAAPPLREPDLVLRGGVLEVSGSSLPGLSLAEGAGKAATSALKGLERLVSARNATLLRVAREVLGRQEAALAGGDLVALTMAEVGAALGLAESTVSRVVAGTSVDTPSGVWWLRALFSRDMGGVSAAALRARVAALIATEARPLSDQAIADLLTGEGARIARRTVAKYREELGLPPASGRR